MTHPTHVEFDTILEHMLGQRLPGRPKQDPFVESAVQNYKIGSRLQGQDALTWHYCRCGANGITAVFRDRGAASLVVPSGAFITIGAQVAGSYTLVINDTGVAADRPAGYYANGKIEIWNAVAAEHMHRIIKDSTVGDGTSITLTLYYPLAYAVPAGTGGEICRSIYADVEQTNLSADPTFESIACVPMMGPVTALSYFWGVTWGMCSIAISADVGLVASQRLVTFNHNDGTIHPYADGEQVAGYLVPSTTGPAAQTIIMLQLDP